MAFKIHGTSAIIFDSYKFSFICASLCFLMYVHGLLFQKAEDDTRASWDDRSELCLLKVGHFGEICTLVFYLFQDNNSSIGKHALLGMSRTLIF